MGFPTPFGVSRSLAEAAGMAVWEYDAADDAVHVGPGAESLGLAPVAPPERLEDWLARLHPEDREEARAALAAALAGGAPLRAEWRLASAADSWRWVELQAGRVEGPSGRPVMPRSGSRCGKWSTAPRMRCPPRRRWSG
jgi:two-component system sensor histidine kinase/response regulator